MLSMMAAKSCLYCGCSSAVGAAAQSLLIAPHASCMFCSNACGQLHSKRNQSLTAIHLGTVFEWEIDMSIDIEAALSLILFRAPHLAYVRPWIRHRLAQCVHYCVPMFRLEWILCG